MERNLLFTLQIIWLSSFMMVGSFVIASSFLLLGKKRRHTTRSRDAVCWQLALAEQKDGDGNQAQSEDDSLDENQIPYRNRSLAWTNRYRKLLPYDSARIAARALGLQSEDEWEEFIADGNSPGPYLPSYPEEMYADDWVSWDDFLGTCLSYDEARNLVQSIFKFQSMKEYVSFIKDDPRRAEGLRLPYLPAVVYKNKGWISDNHFLGRE